MKTCGAKTRSGKKCKLRPMKGKKRCRMHGGKSTGPKTMAGKKKISRAKTKHGAYSKYLPLSTEERQFKLDFQKQWKNNRFKLTDEVVSDMLSNYLIHIHRGLKWADEKGKMWDFSRIGDATLRAFREMKTTPLGREGEDHNVKFDLMSILGKLNEKGKEK